MRQLFVVVERASACMRMRLIPVQHGGERVAAVNQELGIVPLEILGDGDPGALTEVYHVFRRLQLTDAPRDGDERLASTFDAWRTALARSDIDLRLERRALYGGLLPQPDWRANPRGLAVRPWDFELTALAAGLRRIVKWDHVPSDRIDGLRHIAVQRGLRVEVVAAAEADSEASAPAGFATLLVARDASALVAARELETLLLLRGGAAPGAIPATLQMGELLGYPRCCVARFTRIAEQNDTTLAWTLLPGIPHPPASPLTQWLHAGLALLSHVPCDLHCAASVALGERMLEALDAQEPGFATRWRSPTARLQVVDHCGNRLALAVDGRLEAGATVVAADVLVSGGDDPDVTTRAQRLVGRTVQPDSGGLVATDGSWYAPYVADHRGTS